MYFHHLQKNIGPKFDEKSEIFYVIFIAENTQLLAMAKLERSIKNFLKGYAFGFQSIFAKAKKKKSI